MSGSPRLADEINVPDHSADLNGLIFDLEEKGSMGGMWPPGPRDPELGRDGGGGGGWGGV